MTGVLTGRSASCARAGALPNKELLDRRFGALAPKPRPGRFPRLADNNGARTRQLGVALAAIGFLAYKMSQDGTWTIADTMEDVTDPANAQKIVDRTKARRSSAQFLRNSAQFCAIR